MHVLHSHPGSFLLLVKNLLEYQDVRADCGCVDLLGEPCNTREREREPHRSRTMPPRTMPPCHGMNHTTPLEMPRHMNHATKKGPVGSLTSISVFVPPQVRYDWTLLAATPVPPKRNEGGDRSPNGNPDWWMAPFMSSSGRRLVIGPRRCRRRSNLGYRFLG